MRFLRSGRQSDKSDEEIISSYRSTRDISLIGVLFDRYSHLVFAVAMKYLRNEEDSKDVVLEIFEKLPKDLTAYEIRNFSSWIHTVTRNHCFRFLSSRNYYTGTELLEDTDENDEETFQSVYLPLLGEAIGELNAEQKICIELFYIKNLSYEEVSSATGYTMNQVKSYIQNGKRNLKIILLRKSNEQ